MAKLLRPWPLTPRFPCVFLFPPTSLSVSCLSITSGMNVASLLPLLVQLIEHTWLQSACHSAQSTHLLHIYSSDCIFCTPTVHSLAASSSHFSGSCTSSSTPGSPCNFYALQRISFVSYDHYLTVVGHSPSLHSAQPLQGEVHCINKVLN